MIKDLDFIKNERIRRLLDPQIYGRDKNKQLIFRDDYIDLTKALTLFIYKEIANKYSFLPQKDRYHLLIPVLAHLSGEWATYIVNNLYRLKDLSKSEISFLGDNTENLIENNMNQLERSSNFRDNTDMIKNSFFLKVLITHLIINFKKEHVIKKILKKTKSLKEPQDKRKSTRLIKDFFIEFKNRNLISGYGKLSCFKILLKTYFKNNEKLYEKSKNYTNKFISVNSNIGDQYIQKYFQNNQLENIIDIVFNFLPSQINPASIRVLSKKKNYSFFPIRFCGPYQRDMKIVQDLFITRLNKKLIIGSQHGSDYGYTPSNIKFQFSEFLLDGYISTGFDERQALWAKPFLGFIPTSPKFSKLNKPAKKNNPKSKDNLSCLYIESQIDLNKSMISDRMNYSLAHSKYKTYVLLNFFLNDLHINKYNFKNINIRPWLKKEILSPLQESVLANSKEVNLIKGKLVNFISDFEGLIILDDLSTPMIECIAMNKPFIIIISSINSYTKYSEKFFLDMIKNKFIVTNLKDAQQSINSFIKDSKKYLDLQIKVCKSFKDIFCCPQSFKSIDTANKINYLIKDKIKNTNNI